MGEWRQASRVLGAAIAISLVAAPQLHAQQTLTLEQVYSGVRANNQELAAMRLRVAATGLREGSAGLPGDPSLRLGVMNLSLPGLRADMPASMAPSIQLMQMIPIPPKLSLSGRVAGKSTETVQAEAEAAWWELRAHAAALFYELYSYDAQLRVLNSTSKLIDDSRRIATAMYAAGTGRQSDVLSANVESAKMHADIVRMRAMRAGVAARLNALLNRPATESLDSVLLGATMRVPALDTLRAWAETAQPELVRARTLLEQAQLQRALSAREIWPDLTVGIEYGQRRADMGTERMGSLVVGFTVPVFARQRQLRMRDEAAAMEQMARAELASAQTRIDARLRELHSALEANTTLSQLYRTGIIPQAEANVQSALSSYRTGAVDFMTLLQAQMNLNRFRQEQYALVAERGTMLAELEAAIGRELPPRAPLFAEEL